MTFAWDLLSGLRGVRSALVDEEDARLAALNEAITVLEKAEERGVMPMQEAAVEVVKAWLPAAAKPAAAPAKPAPAAAAPAAAAKKETT